MRMKIPKAVVENMFAALPKRALKNSKLDF
jgi:hypothetical protein